MPLIALSGAQTSGSDGMRPSSSPTGSGYRVPSANGIRSASAWAPLMPVLPKKPTCTHAVGGLSGQNAQADGCGRPKRLPAGSRKGLA